MNIEVAMGQVETLTSLTAIARKLDQALAAAKQVNGQSGTGPGEWLQSLMKLGTAKNADEVFDVVLAAAVEATGAERGLVMTVIDGRRVEFRLGKNCDASFL